MWHDASECGTRVYRCKGFRIVCLLSILGEKQLALLSTIPESVVVYYYFSFAHAHENQCSLLEEMFLAVVTFP